MIKITIEDCGYLNFELPLTFIIKNEEHSKIAIELLKTYYKHITPDPIVLPRVCDAKKTSYFVYMGTGTDTEKENSTLITLFKNNDNNIYKVRDAIYKFDFVNKVYNNFLSLFHNNSDFTEAHQIAFKGIVEYVEEKKVISHNQFEYLLIMFNKYFNHSSGDRLWDN